MTNLIVATEGPCAGHPCDNCRTCRSGHCCRRDNPDYQLPGLGDWDGPIYGDIGVLMDDGAKVECHCCGEWFVTLGSHLMAEHDLTHAEYRSIFGLNKRRALASSAFRAKISARAAMRTEHNAAMLAKARQVVQSATPEQIYAWHHPGEMRFEARTSISAAKGGQKFYECVICGTMVQHKWAAKMKTCGPACASELLRRQAKAQGLGTTHRPPQAKIGMENATDIRRRYADGESKRALARAFSVSHSTISQIINGVTWQEGSDHKREQVRSLVS